MSVFVIIIWGILGFLSLLKILKFKEERSALLVAQANALQKEDYARTAAYTVLICERISSHAWNKFILCLALFYAFASIFGW